MPGKLLLATNNRGKVREYLSLLSQIPFDLVTPGEIGITAEVSEDGDSYEANARLKAVTLAEASGLPALADDSGLEVDALGGEPGVRSARYAGEGASDRQRIDYLLHRLKGVPRAERTARFRCVIAVATPEGGIEFCSGDCPGMITDEIRGEAGFGYDPVFYLPEMEKTMAELSFEEKNRCSHRARAARDVPVLLARLGI